jgi:hypothetical protein
MGRQSSVRKIEFSPSVAAACTSHSPEMDFALPAAAIYPTTDRLACGIRFIPERIAMNIHLTLGPLMALIAGILILIVPRLLNFIVAIYLILIGVIGLFGAGNFLH